MRTILTSWSARGFAAGALSLALAAGGCAIGGPRAGAQGGAAAQEEGTATSSTSTSFEIYTVYHMPAWTATMSQQGGWRASVQLEKSRLSQGGDGSASMVFAQAAKKWCQERGAARHETLEYVEYWEAMIVGAARKARGEIRCAA